MNYHLTTRMLNRLLFDPTTFLPCPFCEGLRVTLDRTMRTGEEALRHDPHADAWAIRCMSCAAIGPWAKTISGAIRQWNRVPTSKTPTWPGTFARYYDDTSPEETTDV